ncbi:hypothetical protein HKX48_004060 [Thoreauomyces humboldtii]|nr:hypothetical protein HKX48_004060 [Thoreauomyces humboldtii]
MTVENVEVSNARWLALLDKIDDYDQHRKLLSRALSQGSFDLAKAKYALGPGSLSRVQYDGRMRSTRTVTVTERQLERRERRTEEEDKGKEEELQKVALELVQEQSSDSGERLKKSGNPINWFAPLPPTSLRDAQTHFGRAVQLAVALSNIARDIHGMREDVGVGIPAAAAAAAAAAGP